MGDRALANYHAMIAFATDHQQHCCASAASVSSTIHVDAHVVSIECSACQARLELTFEDDGECGEFLKDIQLIAATRNATVQ